MRRIVRLLLPFTALLLFCAAAHAQPARQQQPPERSARCRAASLKYLGPSPDKKHLTVEQEDEYEYRGMQKYLRVCGDSDDDFTRRIKQAVASHEAAARASSRPAAPASSAPCDERRAALSLLLSEPHKWRERAGQNYEAVKKFLRDCGDENEAFDRHLFKWVEKYDRAVREFEEKKRQSGEAPAKGPTKEQ